MKRSLMILLIGLLFVGVGLLMEYFNVNRMCNQTGYWHLQSLDTFFYALHSEKSVVAMASVFNFLIGISVAFLGSSVVSWIKKGTSKR